LAEEHVSFNGREIKRRYVLSIRSSCRAENSSQIAPGWAIHRRILHSKYGQLVGCTSASRIVKEEINIFPS
jgi:hypothetical protein